MVTIKSLPDSAMLNIQNDEIIQTDFKPAQAKQALPSYNAAMRTAVQPHQPGLMPLYHVQRLDDVPWDRYATYIEISADENYGRWYSSSSLLKTVLSSREAVVNTLVYQQSGESYSAANEVVDNAGDWTQRAQGILRSLGQFGQGSKQPLGYLQEPLSRARNGNLSGDLVSWTSSTAQDRGKARRQIYYMKDGKIHISLDKPEGNFSAGTKAQVRIAAFKEDPGFRKKLRDEILQTYGDGNYVPYILDGDLINTTVDPKSILHLGKSFEGGFLIKDAMNHAVHINTYLDGFEVIDKGPGMDDKVFLTVLPLPYGSENSDEVMAKMKEDVKIEDETNADISLAYGKVMRVPFLVGPRRMIELEVHSEGQLLPEKIVIRLPVTVTLRSNKNTFVIDEDKVAQEAFDHLSQLFFEAMKKETDIERKTAMLNGFVKIMAHLKEMKKVTNGHDFITDFIARAKEEVLVPILKQQKDVLFLPSILKRHELEAQIQPQVKVYYLDRLFFGDPVLLEVGLPRSHFFGSQRVYVLPGEAGPVEFDDSVLFIPQTVEKAAAEAEDHERALEPINLALEENGITGFHASEQRRGDKEHSAFVPVLQRLAGFSTMSAEAQEGLLRNLEGGALDPEALNAVITKAVQASAIPEPEPSTEGPFKVIDISEEQGIQKLRGYLSRGYAFKSDALLGDEYFLLYRRIEVKPTSPFYNYLVVDRKTGEVVFDSDSLVEPKAIEGLWDLRPGQNSKSKTYYRGPYAMDEQVANGRLVVDLDFKTKAQKLSKKISNITASTALPAAQLGLYLFLTRPWEGIPIIQDQPFYYFYFVSLLIGTFYNSLYPGLGSRPIQRLSANSDKWFKSLQWFVFWNLMCLHYQAISDSDSIWQYRWPILLGLGIWMGSYFGPWETKYTKKNRLLSQDVLGRFNNPETRVPAIVNMTINGTTAIFDLEHLKMAEVPRKIGHQTVRGPDGYTYVAVSSALPRASFKSKSIGRVDRIQRINFNDPEPKAKNFYKFPNGERISSISADDQGVYFITMSRKGPGGYLYFYDHITQRTNKINLPSWVDSNSSISTIKGSYKGKVFMQIGMFLYSIDLSGKEDPKKLFEEITSYNDGPGRYGLLGSRIVFDKENEGTIDTGNLYDNVGYSTVYLGKDYVLISDADRQRWRKLVPSAVTTVQVIKSSVDQQGRRAAQRQAKVLDNLDYLPRDFLRDNLAPLLPYVSGSVLKQLSPQNLEKISTLLKPNSAMTHAVQGRLLLFFERLSHTLQGLSPSILNTVVSNWLNLITQEDGRWADQFLEAMGREYEENGKRLTGEDILARGNPEEIPPLVRQTWTSLMEEGGESFPQRQSIETFLPAGEIVSSISSVRMARIYYENSAKSWDLSLDDLKKKLQEAVPSNVSENFHRNDFKLSSSVRGQDITTMIRELIQNARDKLLEFMAQNPHLKPRIDVCIYYVKRADGKYALVVEVRDNASGMDDYVIINKLFPLGESTKPDHMGQGFNTIWAQMEPEDSVQVETRPAHRPGVKDNSYGYVLEASKIKLGVKTNVIMVDSLRKVLLPNPNTIAPGTSVRQIRIFDDLPSLLRQAQHLKKYLHFYAGPVKDVDIYLHTADKAQTVQKINEKSELAAALQFGHLGQAKLFINGGGVNRVLYDQLPMPDTLDVLADKYLPLVPLEDRNMILRWGIDMEIAKGILLDTARTSPANPDFLPFIQKCGALEVMILEASHWPKINKVTDSGVYAGIKQALFENDPDIQDLDRLNRTAAILNHKDKDGQQPFHLLDENYVRDPQNWYRLVVRVKFDGQHSLLGLTRGAEAAVPALSGLEPLVLPRQHKEFPRQLQPKKTSATEEAISLWKNQSLSRRDFIKTFGKVMFLGAIVKYFPNIYKFASDHFYEPFHDFGWTIAEYEADAYNWFSKKPGPAPGGQPKPKSPLDESHGTPPFSPPKGASAVLAGVQGLEVGEYAIPGLDSMQGDTGNPHVFAPQGKQQTGRNVYFTLDIGGYQKGDIINLFQIIDGVPERIDFQSPDIQPDSLDITDIENGKIKVLRSIPPDSRIRYVIPRRTKHNKLVGVGTNEEWERRYQIEKKEIDEDTGLNIDMSNLKERISGLSREKALKIVADYLASKLHYDDTQTIEVGRDFPFMRLLSTADSSRPLLGPCYIFSMYYLIILRYLGFHAYSSNVYPYVGGDAIFNNLAHSDNYIIDDDDGLLYEARWEKGKGIIHKTEGNYSPDENLAKEWEKKSPTPKIPDSEKGPSKKQQAETESGFFRERSTKSAEAKKQSEKAKSEEANKEPRKEKPVEPKKQSQAEGPAEKKLPTPQTGVTSATAKPVETPKSSSWVYLSVAVAAAVAGIVWVYLRKIENNKQKSLRVKGSPAITQLEEAPVKVDLDSIRDRLALLQQEGEENKLKVGEEQSDLKEETEFQNVLAKMMPRLNQAVDVLSDVKVENLKIVLNQKVSAIDLKFQDGHILMGRAYYLKNMEPLAKVWDVDVIQRKQYRKLWAKFVFDVAWSLSEHHHGGVLEKAEKLKFYVGKAVKLISLGKGFDALDFAQASDVIKNVITSKARLNNTGGIDFNADKVSRVMTVQNGGGEIKFHIDPAMLAQLQNAPGFVPVIISIQPLKSLPEFLGMTKNSPDPSV